MSTEILASNQLDSFHQSIIANVDLYELNLSALVQFIRAQVVQHFGTPVRFYEVIITAGDLDKEVLVVAAMHYLSTLRGGLIIPELDQLSPREIYFVNLIVHELTGQTMVNLHDVDLFIEDMSILNRSFMEMFTHVTEGFVSHHINALTRFLFHIPTFYEGLLRVYHHKPLTEFYNDFCVPIDQRHFQTLYSLLRSTTNGYFKKPYVMLTQISYTDDDFGITSLCAGVNDILALNMGVVSPSQCSQFVIDVLNNVMQQWPDQPIHNATTLVQHINTVFFQVLEPPVVRREAGCEKNYAPINPLLNTIPKSHCIKKYNQRQQLAQVIKQHETPRAVFNIHPEFQLLKDKNLLQKMNARKQYQKRSLFKLTSPWLNLNKDLGTISQRVVAYSTSHKCVHKKMYNRVEYHDNILHLKCDHEKERIINKLDPKRCPRCNHTSFYPVARKCNCITRACTFCKYSTYASAGQTRTYCACYVICDLVIPEGGAVSSIKQTITSTTQQIEDYFVGVISRITTRALKDVAQTLFNKITAFVAPISATLAYLDTFKDAASLSLQVMDLLTADMSLFTTRLNILLKSVGIEFDNTFYNILTMFTSTLHFAGKIRKEAGASLTSILASIFGISHTFMQIPMNIKFWSSTNTLASSIKNGADFVRFLCKFCPKLLEFCASYLDADYHFKILLNSDHSDVTNYLTACLLYNNLVLRGADMDEINDARALAVQMKVRWQDYQAKHNLQSASIKNFMDHCSRLLAHQPIGKARTREPFTFKVWSAPGIGKSTFWPLLLTPLLEDSVKTITDKTYVRNPRVEYWEGYDPKVHKIILYDDAFQDTEEDDVSELVALISRAAFIPNYAFNTTEAQPGKGTQADPSFVVLLSNQDKINPKSINCAGAINRRKHIDIQVIAKEDRKRDLSHLVFNVKAYGKELKNLTLKELYEEIRVAYNCFEKVNLDISNDLDQLVYKEAGPSTSYMPSHFRTDNYDKKYDGEVDQKYGIFHVDEWLSEETCRDTIKEYFKKHPDHKVILIAIRNDLNHSRHGQYGRIKPIYAFLKGMFQGFTAVLLITAVFKVYTALLGGIINWIAPQTTSVASESGEIKTSNARSARITPVYKNAEAEMVDLVRNNTVRLTFKQAGIEYTTTAVFVRGRTILTVRHFFHNNEEGDYFIPDGTTIHVDDPLVPKQTYFTFDRKLLAQYSDDLDFVLYRLPSHLFRERRTITHLFCTGNEHLTNKPITVVKYSRGGRLREIVTHIAKDHQQVRYPISPGLQHSEYKQHSTFDYYSAGAIGDCGSLIINEQSTSNQPLLGIHIASNGKTSSYGLIITRQHVTTVLNDMDKILGLETEKALERPDINEANQDYVIKEAGIMGNAMLIGVTNRPIHQPLKTDIRPSPIYEQITEHITEPSALKFYDDIACEMVDLRIRNTNKYTTDLTDFYQPYVDEATESVIEDLNGLCSATEQRLLTQEEAINGNDFDYVDCLNMSTSSGFPFNQHPSTHGEKRLLFDCEDGVYIPKSQLQEEINELLHCVNSNVTSNLCWTMTLKDERRPIEKVRTGKTRLFMAAPLAYTIVSRMFNLMFVAHFYQVRGLCFSQVGIDPASTDWNKMVNRMLEVSENGFDGDFGGWDGKILMQFMVAFVRIVTAWYGDDKFQQRKNLALHANQPRTLIGKYLIQFLHANPSGIDLCVVINTIIDELKFRTAFLALVPQQFRSMYYYRMFVRSSIYGDDNWISVNAMVIQDYNAITIGNYFKQHGIEYTSIDKKNISTAYKPNLQCTFLKRSIGKMDNLYVGIFPEDLCYELLNWIRKCEDEEQACEDNCNAALRFMFFAGKDKYNIMRTKILAIRPTYNLLTYSYLDMNFRQNGRFFDSGVFTKNTLF